MKRKWIVPVVSLVLAAVTTGVIVGYLRSLRSVVVATPEKTEAVVFARSAIAERKIVRADALEIRLIPVSAVHPQAARKIDDVANRVAIAEIFQGEQVLLPKLATPGVSVGLSYVLPKDKRAMTIAVNEVVGVAGFVFPGDRVDVVGTVRDQDLNLTKIVLQNVEVVAIAQKVDQKPGEDPRVTTSATLAVSPEQAETLAQIDNNGRVRLALRPHGVDETVPTTGKTIAAALGRVAAPAVAKAAPAPVRAAARPAPAPRARPATPPPAPKPALHTVDIWRATTHTTVSVER